MHRRVQRRRVLVVRVDRLDLQEPRVRVTVRRVSHRSHPRALPRDPERLQDERRSVLGRGHRAVGDEDASSRSPGLRAKPAEVLRRADPLARRAADGRDRGLPLRLGGLAALPRDEPRTRDDPRDFRARGRGPEGARGDRRRAHEEGLVARRSVPDVRGVERRHREAGRHGRLPRWRDLPGDQDDRARGWSE